MSGKRPVAPEGFTQPSTQLVLRDTGQEPSSGRSTRQRLIMGVMWCSLGSAFLPLAPVLANVLVAFGGAVAMAWGSRRERVIVLLCSLTAGCVSSFALIGATDLPMTVVSIVCAFALARAMVLGTLSTGRVVLAAFLATAVMMVADTAITSQQGTSVSELVSTVVNETVEANLGSLDLEGTTALLETRDQLVAYWPVIYFSVGLGLVLCALAGAWLGARSSGVPVQAGMISRFDVPLWVAVLFAAGVAAQLLGPRLPAWQDETTMVGANVVMCARIVLAQQGLSVLQWWMRERRAIPPVRTAVVLMGVWLELSFALTSVLGLLDVGINFRRFERGRADLIPRPTREG